MSIRCFSEWLTWSVASSAAQGGEAQTFVMTQQVSLQDFKYQAYTRSYIAQKLIPLVRTVGEGVVFLLAPFCWYWRFNQGWAG
ncbi:MAG TPA: hypothetical protein DD706_16105 [Nitrospiraceae bacterium]|nr:hypothetical protein [Nitrospiraceae bacterium]